MRMLRAALPATQMSVFWKQGALRGNWGGGDFLIKDSRMNYILLGNNSVSFETSIVRQCCCCCCWDIVQPPLCQYFEFLHRTYSRHPACCVQPLNPTMTACHSNKTQLRSGPGSYIMNGESMQHMSPLPLWSCTECFHSLIWLRRLHFSQTVCCCCISMTDWGETQSWSHWNRVEKQLSSPWVTDSVFWDHSDKQWTF